MAIRERLVYAIDLVADGARSGLASLDRSVSNTDTGIGRLKSGAASAFDSIKANAGQMALAAGAALVTFGVKSVSAFQDTALEAGKFSDATRLSVEDASRWIEVAGDMGIEAGTIQTSFTKLNKELADGSPTAERYGLSLQKTADGAVDVNATMLKAIDTVKNIEDPTERAAAAQTLFGRSYTEVAELIEAGSTDILRSLNAVSDAKVINEEELEKAREFRDKLDELQDKLQDLMLTVGEKVIPALLGFVEVVEDVDDAIEAAHVDDLTQGLLEVANTAPGVSQLATAIGLLSDNTEDLNLKTGILSGTWEGLKGEEAEAAEVAKQHNTTIEEQRDHTQRMGDATDRARDAIQAKADADKEAARQAESHRQRIEALERQFQLLKNNLSDRAAYLGIADAFDQVDQAATEAWDASAAGAEDAEAKVRAHEQAMLDLKGRVIDYATEVGNIPPETVTEINALIDQGKFDEAEAKLAYLERVRQVTLLINPTLTSAMPTTADGRVRGGRARGGPVSSGGLYEVNENGSELLHENGKTYLMAGANGKVEPLRSGAGTAEIHHHYSPVINNNGRREVTSADVAQAMQMARLAR